MYVALLPLLVNDLPVRLLEVKHKVNQNVKLFGDLATDGKVYHSHRLTTFLLSTHLLIPYVRHSAVLKKFSAFAFPDHYKWIKSQIIFREYNQSISSHVQQRSVILKHAQATIISSKATLSHWLSSM